MGFDRVTEQRCSQATDWNLLESIFIYQCGHIPLAFCLFRDRTHKRITRLYHNKRKCTGFWNKQYFTSATEDLYSRFQLNSLNN